jgi:glutamate decarboxylase
MVLAQYYNFVRLGREGYIYVLKAMEENAKALAGKLEATGDFELIGADREQLPLVAFKLSGEKNYDEFDVSWQLSALRGWMLPAYTMPPDAQEVKIMRALVKQTLSREQVDRLASDIEKACEILAEKGGAHPAERKRMMRGPGY